jgi:hypothetical protein
MKVIEFVEGLREDLPSIEEWEIAVLDSGYGTLDLREDDPIEIDEANKKIWIKTGG